MSSTQLASGILLLLLSVTMIWIGLTLTSMFRLTGWQASLAFELQHVGNGITQALTWIPNWLAAVALLGILGLLARRALRQVAPTSATLPASHEHHKSSTEQRPEGERRAHYVAGTGKGDMR